VPRRLLQFVAVVIVALGISPFTAPFSTCDLGALHGHPWSPDTTQGVVSKTSADPGNAPALVATAASTAPFFSLVVGGHVLPAPLVHVVRQSRAILRI
jgi:hypothetical protein